MREPPRGVAFGMGRVCGVEPLSTLRRRGTVGAEDSLSKQAWWGMQMGTRSTMRRWGLLGALSIVASFAVATPSHAGPARSPEVLPDSEVGVTNEESAALDVSDLVAANGALGMYFDDATGQFVVVVSESNPLSITKSRAAAAGLDVRVETRPIDASDIAALEKAVAELGASEALRGHNTASYFSPHLGKVVVDGTSDPSTFAELTQRFGSAVEFRHSEIGDLSRHNGVEPFIGGAEVANDPGPVQPNVCTTGFTIKNISNFRYMVTAGHCFSLNEELESPGNGVRMGKISHIGPRPNMDVGLMFTEDYNGRVFTGINAADNNNNPVKGAQDPVVGALYCSSGRITFQKCDQRVTAVDGFYCSTFLGGCTPHNLIVYTGGVAAKAGDSGAPFYLNSAQLIYIRGLVIAGNQVDLTYAERWSVIRDQWGVSIVTD